MYFVKSNIALRVLYPGRYWKINTSGKKILYLTFDDGPHPDITPFVLKELRRYNAKATFFCIGNNVQKYPDTYGRILAEAHTVGNHTFSHRNGWKTNADHYLEDIDKTYKIISSNLFRPPYGRMSFAQEKLFKEKYPDKQIIMWDVLSGDFDTDISWEKCLKNVTSKATAGSIIVFHDSEKAFERLRYALPRTLDHFAELGFTFRVL